MKVFCDSVSNQACENNVNNVGGKYGKKDTNNITDNICGTIFYLSVNSGHKRHDRCRANRDVFCAGKSLCAIIEKFASSLFINFPMSRSQSHLP